MKIQPVGTLHRLEICMRCTVADDRITGLATFHIHYDAEVDTTFEQFTRNTSTSNTISQYSKFRNNDASVLLDTVL